jgi:4a-hydroxytetrahydrobiopterin dehydratase
MPVAMIPMEVEEALKAISGWTAKDGCLVKKFTFATYMEGIRFVEAVAIEAEAMDHHPDILVRYADVTVFLSTHSVKGLTYKDFDLASMVDKAFGGFQSSKPL